MGASVRSWTELATGARGGFTPLMRICITIRVRVRNGARVRVSYRLGWATGYGGYRLWLLQVRRSLRV